MRNRGPSKQRVRLGSCRHPCCGRRRYTDANANRQPHCHAATDANAEVGANSKAAAHASAAALDFGPPKISEHRGHGCTSSVVAGDRQACAAGAAVPRMLARPFHSSKHLARARADLWSERQNSVDIFSAIQLEGRSTLWSLGKLISGAGSELVSLRLGPFQPQPLLFNEKEICVSFCPP